MRLGRWAKGNVWQSMLPRPTSASCMHSYCQLLPVTESIASMYTYATSQSMAQHAQCTTARALAGQTQYKTAQRHNGTCTCRRPLISHPVGSQVLIDVQVVAPWLSAVTMPVAGTRNAMESKANRAGNEARPCTGCRAHMLLGGAPCTWW